MPDTPIDGAMIGVRNMFIIGGGDPAFFEKALAAHDAQVLRDAADRARDILVSQRKTLGMPTDEWLRAEADRIAGGTSAHDQ